VERDDQAEQRAEEILCSRAALRDQYRRARRERIAAGQHNELDLHDEEDVVCPFCGAWFEGRELQWNANDPSYRAVECKSCKQNFLVNVGVTYTFTTIVEPT
jgi:hypothetical protein